ncbi:hypothetical protein GOP47_0020121 [Adiantum capillus-veneris]|uniref:Uncharacterized protein n=1 Tax=Adiantum capillus-veneris TaxID=13818 RepID=A0A9D4ZAA9_ADICA|nr:hypothetical protein GOP47_0020121 [Adiantum capillus-veneris]
MQPKTISETLATVHEDVSIGESSQKAQVGMQALMQPEAIAETLAAVDEAEAAKAKVADRIEAMDIEDENATKAGTNKQGLVEEALALIETKGNKATAKYLCSAFHVALLGIFDGLKGLSGDFNSNFSRVESKLQVVKQELMEEIVMLNNLVSKATERSSRSSFADLCTILPP